MRSACPIPRLVQLLVLSGLSVAWAMASSAASLKTGFSSAGEVARGATRTHVLRLDEPTRTRVMLLDRDGSLDFALVSPSGRRFAARADSAAAGTFGEGPYLDMHAKVLVVEAPEVGAWTACVGASASADSTAGAPYVVSVWFDQTDVELTALEVPQVVRGTPCLLRARLLLAEAALPGAEVAAHVETPEGRRDSLWLRDDGRDPDAAPNDGLYTGSLPTGDVAGLYRVAFVADHPGNARHAAFIREASAIAVVSESRSRLAGTFRDRGVDSDGNGRFDYLDVEVDLDVTDPRRYELRGTLKDAAGRAMTCSAQTMLERGKQALVLRFDGVEMRRQQMQGPFRVGDLRLFETEVTLLDQDQRYHAVSSYEARVFDEVPRDARR